MWEGEGREREGGCKLTTVDACHMYVTHQVTHPVLLREAAGALDWLILQLTALDSMSDGHPFREPLL